MSSLKPDSGQLVSEVEGAAAFTPEIPPSANFRLYLPAMTISHCSHFFNSILSVIPAVTGKLFSNLPPSKKFEITYVCYFVSRTVEH